MSRLQSSETERGDLTPIRVAKEPGLRLRDFNPVTQRPPRTFPFCATRRRYFAFARNALHAALEALELRPGDEVLLPAFHCVSLVEAVVRSGAQCRFYGVNRQFQIERDSLDRCLSPRVRVVVVVHYFGFPQPLAELQTLCRSRNIVLIEDCCHALFSDREGIPLGSDGDLSLFSLRKTLPVVDGALLVATDRDIPLPPRLGPPGLSYQARMWRWTAGRLRRQRGFASEEAAGDLAGAPQDGHAPRQGLDRPIPDGWLFGYDVNTTMSRRAGSWATRWLARGFAADPIRRARRRNYTRLLELLGEPRRIRLPFPTLPEGVCPWTFPVDANGIRRLDSRLRSIGVPAFTFGESLHTALPVGQYRDAEYLALNLVQLPIHQDLAEPQLSFVADAVRRTDNNS